MTSVNLEISCIRMGSGPALFRLSRFYCNNIAKIIIIIIITIAYTCTIQLYNTDAHNHQSKLALQPHYILSFPAIQNTSNIPHSYVNARGMLY